MSTLVRAIHLPYTETSRLLPAICPDVGCWEPLRSARASAEVRGTSGLLKPPPPDSRELQPAASQTFPLARIPFGHRANPSHNPGSSEDMGQEIEVPAEGAAPMLAIPHVRGQELVGCIRLFERPVERTTADGCGCAPDAPLVAT
jgi:hypothetical protein